MLGGRAFDGGGERSGPCGDFETAQKGNCDEVATFLFDAGRGERGSVGEGDFRVEEVGEAGDVVVDVDVCVCGHDRCLSCELRLTVPWVTLRRLRNVGEMQGK